jgi:hypothetical protein
MTRLFLAAGVAAMAIATPLAAKPPGGGGGHGNGGGGAPAAVTGGSGGGNHGNGGGHGRGGGGAPVVMGGGGGHGGGFAAPGMQRAERQQARGGGQQQQAQRIEHQQARGGGHQQAQRVERQQARGGGHQQAQRIERQEARGHQQAQRMERQQARGGGHQQGRNVEHQRGVERQQARNLERQQIRENRGGHGGKAVAQRELRQGNRFDQAQQNLAVRNMANAERITTFRNAETSFPTRFVETRGGLIDGCPPGLWMKNNGCMPPGQAAKFLGAPLAAVSGIVPLGVLPQSLGYFYPDTNDYYYRYGDGYLYQVDRDTSLIASLIPLLAGGYLPGQYLPQPYMASYVPDYYGLDAFYPDYGGVCNRYYGGVIYQTDCGTGFVEAVIPMYAGGYGVGQLLPSAYNYYNVPMQYRGVYYDTPDAAYWYSPGAIYRYDPRSSVITSVAALMSPGFAVGQPLPMGYDAYNVPYGYRATYYDTSDAWYRYNNGYIYQVDPVTQIVTAIVASLLT